MEYTCGNFNLFITSLCENLIQAIKKTTTTQIKLRIINTEIE